MLSKRLTTRRLLPAVLVLLIGATLAISDPQAPWLHLDSTQGLLTVINGSGGKIVKCEYDGQMWAELEFPEYGDDGGVACYLYVDDQLVWWTYLMSEVKTGIGAPAPDKPWHVFFLGDEHLVTTSGNHTARFEVECCGQVNNNEYGLLFDAETQFSVP